MNDFDKEELFFAVIMGIIFAVVVTIALWLLSVVWSFKPSLVVLIVLLTPVCSYVAYKAIKY